MPKSATSSSKVSTKTSEWVDPDDIELTDEIIEDLLKNGEIRHGDRVIRRGNPPLDKVFNRTATFRLDPDVLEAYRALGDGWQAQVNADLRKARKLKPLPA